MFCIPDGRCYGLRRTRAFRGFGACIRCPIVLHPGRPLLRLTPLYNSDPTPAPPSGRGIGSVRNSYQRITLSESLCDAWPHAYAARMLYTPNGRSYGLRRCTDYTLPLNLPPREGDLQSRAVRAPGGDRKALGIGCIGLGSMYTLPGRLAGLLVLVMACAVIQIVPTL